MDYGKVFNKIEIYNKNQKRLINEHSNRYYDISFSISERNAVNEMLIQMRSHLIEEMNSQFSSEELQALNEGMFDNFWNKTKEVTNKAIDKTKQAVSDTKDAIVDKYEQFKNGIKILNQLIESGVKTVKELITKLGKLICKLGDTLSSAIEKLGAFKNTPAASVSVEPEFLANIPENQRNFYGLLDEYIQYMCNHESDKVKKLDEGVLDKIANNKTVQWILCYKKGDKWGIWHTILASLIGTLIITIVLPIVLYGFGVAGPTIVAIKTALVFVWSFKGVIKILLNRYVNKGPGEKFFDIPTCIGLVLCVLPIGLMKIPAVKEFIDNGIISLCKLLHLDKLVDYAEDILAKIHEYFTGNNPEMTPAGVKDTGRAVVEQVKHYRIAGGTGMATYSGNGSIQSYVDGLFGAHGALSNFKGANILHKYLNNICTADYTSSEDMLNHLTPGSLPDGAPLTGQFDFNVVFNGMSKKAANELVRKVAAEHGVHAMIIDAANEHMTAATDHATGAVTAIVLDASSTSENAAMLNDILHEVAQKAGNSGATHVVANILNNVHDTITHTVIDHTPQFTMEHTLFKTMVDCFTPMFIPFFDSSKWGDYKARIGSNTTGNPAFVVSKVKHMPLDDAQQLTDNRALDLLRKQNQYINKQYTENYKKSVEEAKKEWEEKKDKSFLDKAKHTLTDFKKKLSDREDPKNNEVIVLYVTYTYKDKDGNKQTEKDKPFILLDPNTLMGCDLATWFKKYRKQPYFLKGAFSKIDFVPTKKDDNETKEFIHSMLNKTMNTAVKQCFSYGCGQMYIIKDKEGKYIPKEGNDTNKPLFDLGNLTIQEMCDVLNDPKDGLKAYELLDGGNGSNIRMTTTKDGALKDKKAVEDKTVIEKKRFTKEENGTFKEDPKGKYDYVDAKIIPFITKKDSDVYNELKADDEIKSILFDKEGNMNTEILTNEQLGLKKFLFRPAKTFSKADQYDLAKKINNFLKEKSKEQKIQAYEVLKRMIEIIWSNIYKVIS